MNKDRKDVLRTIRTKRILALVSAVAIGIAVFAAVGMLSSPQQAEASHGKIVLNFSGNVDGLQVGGQVSGDSFSTLRGQAFDTPVPGNARFYCLIKITGSSEAAGVVTLDGIVTISTSIQGGPNSPAVDTLVTFKVNTVDNFIIFEFPTGMVAGDGFGRVRLIDHQ